MKVGDLVTLSAYGRNRVFNQSIKMYGVDQTGLIVSINGSAVYPYSVRWCKTIHDSRLDRHNRRELRYAY
jgi:hypothetical protein